MANIKSINGNPIVVGASGIDDGAVTTAKLAEGAVTTPKIADGAVTDAKLAQSGGVLEKVDDLESAIGTKAPAIIGTASGAIASFDDGADDMPVKKLVANIEPIQDLHGYDHPWPAGSGKNLFGGTYNEFFPLHFSTDQNVIASVNPPDSGTAQIAFFDENKNRIDYLGLSSAYSSLSNRYARSFTLPKESYYVKFIGAEASDYMIELGNTNTVFEPYSNICPISGWTGAEIERTGKNLIDDSIKTATGSYVYFNSTGFEADKTITLPSGTYTFSVVYADSYASTKAHILVKRANNGGHIAVAYTATSLTFTLTKTEDVLIYMQNKGLLPEYVVTAQLELGSTATDYEPYQGETYDITFPTEAGTVYGGSLDVTTGVLTVDRAMVDLGTLNWLQPTTSIFRSVKPDGAKKAYSALCSNYNFVGQSGSLSTYCMSSGGSGDYVIVNDPTYTDATVFKTAMNGVQLVYELATPITYTLTPQEVRTLLGINNIWADAGDTEVTYPADTKLYIDSKITQAIANALNS